MANIQECNGGGVGPGVTSVNGEGGAVTVSATSGVTSVDGNTGPAVVLSGTYLALTGGTLSGALVGTLSTMTTAIRAGAANWASTGEIRLPSGGAINARNAANNADLGLISANASDQLQLGRDTVPSSDSAVNLGSSARRWATIFGVSVQVGTNPAATGSVRIASTGQINWRNAANSADIGGFSSNASDQIQCATTLVPSSDSAKDLGASGARWANIYGVIGVFGSATNTAEAGAVRMANAAGVNWRNSHNSADIGWTVSSSDLMTTSAGVVAAHLAPASTTGATSAARYFRATASGAPVSGTWVAGDIVPAADGTFWHCTVGGTPGTWVQSGSATYAALTGATFSGAVAMGSNKITGLAAATANGDALRWEQGLAALLTTQGDLPYASAANTPARLAKGTAYQVLRMNSGATAPEWVSGAAQLISETVLGSDTASFDFKSIPATFRHLLLVWSLRSDAGAAIDTASTNFNNDTTNANYDREFFQAAASSTTALEKLATTASRSGATITGNTAPASQFGHGHMLIHNYANTSFYKVATVEGSQWSSRSSNGMLHWWNILGWANTAAINRVTFTPVTGTNFKTSSVMALYGIG